MRCRPTFVPGSAWKNNRPGRPSGQDISNVHATSLGLLRGDGRSAALRLIPGGFVQQSSREHEYFP